MKINNDVIKKQLISNNLQNNQSIKKLNEHILKIESKNEQHFAKINELLNKVQELNEKYQKMEEHK